MRTGYGHQSEFYYAGYNLFSCRQYGCAAEYSAGRDGGNYHLVGGGGFHWLGGRRKHPRLVRDAYLYRRLDVHARKSGWNAVVLIDEQCGSLENFDINLDDDATPGDFPCPLTDGGTYQPAGTLGNFIGQASQGTWRLIVEDSADLDTGVLQGWTLDLCVSGIDPPEISIAQTAIVHRAVADSVTMQSLVIENLSLDTELTVAIDESEATGGSLAAASAASALHLTPCVNGSAGGFPCDAVDLLEHMPNAIIGGGNGNDIWGWTDPQTGKEYALMGRTSGTSFVDLSDPGIPIYLGNLPTHTSNSSWRDIKVYANHAFIVSEANGHGMQIFDLTQLRNVTTPPSRSAIPHTMLGLVMHIIL